MPKQVRLLFIVLPSWDMPHLTGKIKDSLAKHTSHYTTVTSRDQYFKLEDRYTYNLIAVWGLPGFSKEVIEDQLNNSTALEYIHSLSVGVDEHCSI